MVVAILLWLYSFKMLYPKYNFGVNYFVCLFVYLGLEKSDK